MLSSPLPWDRAAIERILPHRGPALLIDRVLEGSAEQVVAVKRTQVEEACYQGHFPGRPVMPGVVLIEIMAQASLILYAFNFAVEHLFFLAKVKAQFFAPVTPGLELRIVARRVKVIKTMGLTEVEVFVGDVRAATAQLGFAAADAPSPAASPTDV